VGNLIFNSLPISKDFVDLSIGKIFFKELDTGTLNKALSKCTISGSRVNNNLFFMMMEKKLINLSNRQLQKLPVTDGQKIREKVREILIRNKVITDFQTNTKEQFSEKDKAWFENTADDMKKHLVAAGTIPHG